MYLKIDTYLFNFYSHQNFSSKVFKNPQNINQTFCNIHFIKVLFRSHTDLVGTTYVLKDYIFMQ